jgi:hypothetical protein
MRKQNDINTKNKFVKALKNAGQYLKHLVKVGVHRKHTIRAKNKHNLHLYLLALLHSGKECMVRRSRRD